MPTIFQIPTFIQILEFIGTFAFERELTENPTHVVLVVDDLTATMSCAIVAKKQNIKVAHLVAGTSSLVPVRQVSGCSANVLSVMQGIPRKVASSATLPERWDGRTAERIVQILLGE